MEVQGFNKITKKVVQPPFQGGITNVPSREDTTTMKIYGNQKGINIKGQYLINTSPNQYKELKTIKAPFSNEMKLYKLNNGQNVIILPKKGPTVIKTFVDVGSMNERDNVRGISHVDEHMMFNGSENLEPGEFVDVVYGMGASYNASTGFAATDYYISTPLHKPKDLDEAIKIHADMITSPRLSKAQLEKEKGPVTSEIQMYEDDPYNVAYNNVLKQLFNVQTKSPDMIGGCVSNIKEMTPKDIRDHYETYYTPERMTTVVVGNVSPEKTIKLLAQNFAHFKRKTPEDKVYHEKLTPLEKTKRTDIISPRANSAIVNMAFAGPHSDNLKETMIFNAINTALTGYGNAILSKNLEKFDTTVSLDTEVISSDNSKPQAIILSSEFKPGAEEAGMQEIYNTIENFKNTQLSNKDLAIVKNKLINSLKYSSESSMSIATHIGSSIVNRGSLSYYSDSPAIINSISAQDIQNVAKKYLDLNKTSIFVVHPKKQKIVANAKPMNMVSFGSLGVAQSIKPNIGEVKELDLNNYRVVLQNNKDSEFVSTIISFNQEKTLDFKPGTDWILESLLNKGTAFHSKEVFNELSDSNNLYISPSVNNDGITFNIFGEPKNLNMAMDLTKELINSPNFTQEEFDKAKSEIKLAINSMKKHPIERLQEKLYPNNANGHSTRLIKENIENVTLEDVKELYAQSIINSEAIVTSTFSQEKYPNSENIIIEKLQSGMPQARPYSFNIIKEYQNIDKNYVLTDTTDQNQAVILQAYKFKESGNVKDEAGFSLLNEILGGNSHSMLFDDLREKQKLAYDVHSNYVPIGDTGIIKLKIKTTTKDKKNNLNSFENIQKSLDGFKHYTDKLQNELVSSKQLEQAKLALLGDLINLTQRTEGQNTVLASGYKTSYGSSHSLKLIKAINAITAQDIQNYARYAFSQNSVVSMVASKDSIDANKDYLASIGTLEQYN